MKKNTFKSILHNFSLKSQKKVDFLVCGAQKSGTTSLDSYFRKHTDICLPKNVKELHFFDKDKVFTSLFPSLHYAQYHSFFQQQKNHKITGEITPSYMYWEPSAVRIWKYNPKIKLIFVLRNPIERAFSHWSYNKQLGIESLNFEDAIMQEESRCRNSLPKQNMKWSYTQRGFYTNQIRRFQRLFPSEQMIIINYDDYIRTPENTLNDLTHFLDIKPFPYIKEIHKNKTINKPEITQKEFLLLKKVFYYEIKNLEDLLQWDCPQWLETPLHIYNS